MSSEKAILAGGCFWGMEDLIRQFPGVTDTQAGYTGGQFENPTHKDMTTGKTGHAESVEITFDNEKQVFEKLLHYFFSLHDPSTPDRQGNDKGSQYRSAIFYTNEDQKKAAEKVVGEIDASGKWPGRVVTEVVPASTFYEAEDYHQDYLQKNPGGYTCHWVRPDWIV